ncbi:MAG: hypothetical protein AAGA20_19315 [Planctomycetota bacterium]
MSRLLLQTTITRASDDWHVGRFSRLARHLASMGGPGGAPLHAVTSRDREPGADGVDPVLRDASPDAFDQIWVFGVDAGGETGLAPEEVAGLRRFYERGGALMLTRDHQDMGCALSGIGDVGAAHCWHSVEPEEDPERRVRDDENPSIEWPNYHSGRNGAFQSIERLAGDHALLEGVDLLPAHPHEGALRVPEGGVAIARSSSRLSGRHFLLAVAFDHPASDGAPGRRAVAQSTFHHFADYNIDVGDGAPSFVTDPVAPEADRDPEGARQSIQYWENLAGWLGEPLTRR